LGLPYNRRLRKSSEFRKTFSRGRRAGDRLLAAAAGAADNDESRFGFAVSSRVGGAVHRNTIKRRLREIVRRLPTNGSWDVVISARPAARDASYSQLERSMLGIASKLGITNGHDAR
jgi:ribonuclease P protein component